jgi:hypothetical protein
VFGWRASGLRPSLWGFRDLEVVLGGVMRPRPPAHARLAAIVRTIESMIFTPRPYSSGDILNTSLNESGKPIVESIADGLECSDELDIKYFALGDYLLSKTGHCFSASEVVGHAKVRAVERRLLTRELSTSAHSTGLN